MQTGKDRDEDELTYVLATKVPILKVAQEGQNMILDANYATTDLDERVNDMESLSAHQKKQLIETLKNFLHCSVAVWVLLILSKSTWRSMKVQHLNTPSHIQCQKHLKN